MHIAPLNAERTGKRAVPDTSVECAVMLDWDVELKVSAFKNRLQNVT